MKDKKLYVVSGLLILLVVFTLGLITYNSLQYRNVTAQSNASINCPSGLAGVDATGDGLVFTCTDVPPEVTSTPTNTVLPPTSTITPTLEVTATITPTVQPTVTNTPIVTPTETIVPTPTPTETVRIEPYPDAPLCAEHNNRAYHTLWNYELGCHYDHTHGDNPHELDDVFGTDIYTYIGGEISYPWATPNENGEVKHKSYMWLTGKDIPCYSRYTEGCITNYRVMVHNDLYNPFSYHHSAVVEAKVCLEADPTRCGYFLVSGHQATGDLLIDAQQVLDRPRPPYAPRPLMLHYDTVGSRLFATWYPTLGAWMRASTQINDMWGYYPLPEGTLPITDTNKLVFTPLVGNERNTPNASNTKIDILGVGWAQFYNSLVDPDGDGVGNYDGFMNVMSAVPGDDCTEISEMCSPFIIRDVPRADYQYNGSPKEYDIFFDGISSHWLTFPGFDPPRP